MLIMTAKLPAKKLFFLAFLLLAALLIPLLLPNSSQNSTISGKNDAERCAYLASFGWEVETLAVETAEIALPELFEESHLSYNEMQKMQGFDLSPLTGKTLQRHTYRVLNHPCCSSALANLYTYEEKIVAGDIVCAGENGFLSDLKFPQ